MVKSGSLGALWFRGNFVVFFNRNQMIFKSQEEPFALIFKRNHSRLVKLPLWIRISVWWLSVKLLLE